MDHRWYERELGWPTVGTAPPCLVTGVRFDVLDVPAEAGFPVLARFPGTGPVAVHGRRMRLLVAPGSAEELPGLLDWLEWGGIALDLAAMGQDGLMAAPAPPVPPGGHARRGAAHAPGSGPGGTQAAPVWLRPPVPGQEVDPSLPALSLTGRRQGFAVGGAKADGAGGAGDPVGLMALVSSLSTACHRVRLRRDQPCAFSYASRMDAGTRPRSLTS